MINCPDCGKALPNGTIICPDDGADLEAVVIMTPPDMQPHALMQHPTPTASMLEITVEDVVLKPTWIVFTFPLAQVGDPGSYVI